MNKNNRKQLLLTLLLPVLIIGIITHAQGYPSLDMVWQNSSETPANTYVAVNGDGGQVIVGRGSSVSFYGSDGSGIGGDTVSGSVVDVEISVKNGRAYVLTDGNTIYGYEFNGDNFYKTMEFWQGDPLYCMDSSSDGYILVHMINVSESAQPELLVHDVPSNSGASYDFNPETRISSLAVSNMVNDRSLIVVGGTDYSGGHVYVFEYIRGGGIGFLNDLSIDGRVKQVDISETGKYFAVLYENDQGVNVVAIGTIDSMGTINDNYGFFEPVYSIDLQDYDASLTTRIAVGASDVNILEYDGVQLVYKAGYGANDADDTKVSISYYGNYVASSSTSNNIYIYDLENDILDYTSPGAEINSIGLSGDGSTIVSGSSSGGSYYYTTGVVEGLPVPVPEPWITPLLLIAPVIIYLLWRKNSA